MMSFLPFWALNVVVALLSMEGQRALGFYQTFLNLIMLNEGLTVWNDMRVNN